MLQQQEDQRSTFRLDVPLHQLLTKPSSGPVEFQPIGIPQHFPDPVFPQRAELLGSIDEDDGWRPPRSGDGRRAKFITRCRAGFFLIFAHA
jgi:hypothetical protein